MDTKQTFALKGDILWAESPKRMAVRRGQVLLCENGRVAGVFPQLPEAYAGVPVDEHGGRLIIPGLIDLHVHAPQFAFRGLGMDLELLEWLNTRTFPEEAKYAEMAYAEKAYGLFAEALAAGGTTRACVFATVHREASLMLMDKLEATGLVTKVGKVNMDRNTPDALREADAAASLSETRDWLAAAEGRYARTAPILTPRFVPSCSDELMQGLAAIQKENGLPVQSHLSENLAEGAWVKELCPGVETYAEAYARHGLFGGEACPTIMAHCVYSLGREMEELAEAGVWVAHCPLSNSGLASGIAPVRAFLDKGLRAGLGSDVAGGYDISIFGVMANAVKDSKLRWRLVDDSLAPLGLPEAFWLATRGGGSFFGKVGAFEPGYEFDALVLDDSGLPCPFELSPEERLERIMYLGGDANVRGKYVAGRKVM